MNSPELKKCSACTKTHDARSKFKKCPDCRAKRMEHYFDHRDEQKAQAHRYYSKNKDRFKEKARSWKLQKVYGISEQQFQAMEALQDGRCAICSNKDEKKRLAVDHNHATGKIRSLLCFKCNTVLGKVGEDIELLGKFIKYLESHATR